MQIHGESAPSSCVSRGEWDEPKHLPTELSGVSCAGCGTKSQVSAAQRQRWDSR